MSRPWERSQTLLNSAAPEDIISSNVNPAAAGAAIAPGLQNAIGSNPLAQAASSALASAASNPLASAAQSTLTSATNAASGALSSAEGAIGSSVQSGLTSVLNSGSAATSSLPGSLSTATTGNSLTGNGLTGSSFTSPMSRFGSGFGGMGMGSMYGGYGGYGGLGGYGRYGMQTGNQMMDQMNQYVVGISEMAGMVEQNASGLAKFILLLRKMAEQGLSTGKSLALKGYAKAIEMLSKVRELLREKLQQVKAKLGFGIQEAVPSLAYFPNERKRLEEEHRARLEKQIKFLDWCLYLILGLVAFNVVRLFLHEIKKIM